MSPDWGINRTSRSQGERATRYCCRSEVGARSGEREGKAIAIELKSAVWPNTIYLCGIRLKTPANVVFSERSMARL